MDQLWIFALGTLAQLLFTARMLVQWLLSEKARKVVNPTAIQGQIEGGVVMGLGYALTEDFPLMDGKPLGKYGTIGLFRADTKQK